MMKNRIRFTAAMLSVLVALAACGGQEPEAASETRTTGRAATQTPSPGTPTAASPAPLDTQSPATNDTGAAMDILLAIGDDQLRGSLDDTPAGREFATLLPLTLTLTDFHETEKISDLPQRISTDDDVPAGTAGSAGEITIYAPWGNLALFYRDFTYTDDLVRLGNLEPGAADILAHLPDDTTITITKA